MTSREEKEGEGVEGGHWEGGVSVLVTLLKRILILLGQEPILMTSSNLFFFPMSQLFA